MSEAILEARGVVKRYGKFTALGGVDLRIMPRTIHSVIGPNGAGKTTLFHTLTGTVPISAGSILFDGHDVSREPDHKRVRRGMARSFQVTSLFANLSVRENLRVAAQGVESRRALNPGRRPLARGHIRVSSTTYSIGSACSGSPTRRPACCRTASSAGSKSGWRWRRGRARSSSTSRRPAWVSTTSTT
jgi:ABC-type lipopolysaccharide export system ATPase subunit